METPHQTIARLLTALETLTREEETLFESGFYVESTAVQQRAMPLVRKIAELLVGPNVAQTLEKSIQLRLHELLKSRQAHYERLSARLDETQKELEKIATAQTRAKRLRPVYSGPSMPEQGLRPSAALAAEA
ncbi:MAG: hypothetical protein QM715_11620 [Nibricoccus sp.]